MSELTVEQKELIADRIVACLQDAFEADPSGMHALVVNRVPTTQAMVEHPHIVCESNPILDEHPPVLGMLGVLNGVLEAAGIPKVASKWESPPQDSPNDPHIFIGFGRWRSAQPVQPAAE
jgi:hypothetical protein